MPTPTSALAAAITAALAPILTAAVVLFKLNLTGDQQAKLVLGAAAVVAVVGVAYNAITTHSASKVAVAVEGTKQAQAYASNTITATLSDGGLSERVAVVESEVKALKSKPVAAPRVRPSRAKAPAAAKK